MKLLGAASRRFLTAFVFWGLNGLACPAAVPADQMQIGSAAEMSFYAPSTSEETFLSHTQAVITSFEVGNRYGEVDIRDGNGQTIKMLIGGDLLIEGHTVACTDAPHPGDDINEVKCPDWPDNIVLGRTLVTVTYWKDELNYKPLFVVSRIDITRGPFVP